MTQPSASPIEYSVTSDMLDVQHLSVSYGAIRALHDVSLTIARGQIVALIGANGAGKTTLLRAVSGLVPIASGNVSFEGQPIRRRRADEIVRLGMSHVPEGRQVFANLTVRENLQLGGYQEKSSSVLSAGIEDCFSRFPVLRERHNQKAATLSGGEQQMLVIGRALMQKPKLLLLDEPSLGLAPLIIRQIFQIIREINAAGTTVFLVEQNAHMALSIAHHAYVLQSGELIKSAPARELLNDPDVKKAYLGG